MANERTIDVTISVTDETLSWAIHHINSFIASQPVNTEPLAHAFVSALSNPLATRQHDAD
jgi:hypothetical protein